MTALATLPIWRCVNCTEATYSERRPKGWGWGAGGLRCPACWLRFVGERRKQRKGAKYKPARHERVAPLRTEPVEVERACEECGAVFELGVKRVKRFCGDACRQAAKRRRLGKSEPERSPERR